MKFETSPKVDRLFDILLQLAKIEMLIAKSKRIFYTKKAMTPPGRIQKENLGSKVCIYSNCVDFLDKAVKNHKKKIATNMHLHNAQTRVGSTGYFVQNLDITNRMSYNEKQRRGRVVYSSKGLTDNMK